jgi:MFS family permease
LEIDPILQKDGKMGTQKNKDSTINTIFRSLKYRNYRLFFYGQSLSLIGTWMQRLAVGWLVYRLTNSAFWLGVVSFAGQIPCFFMTPFGGVAADRYKKQTLLIITQVLSMLQALVLALLVLTDTAVIWHLIILNISLGVINAFDMPTRQAFVVEMVEKREDLGNAIALNSSMVNVARLLGPSIAGLLVATAGEGVCFLVNAASYFAVIVSLFLMKVSPAETKLEKASAWQQVKGGLRYAFGFAPIKYIILLLALVSITGMPYVVLMPIFARDILHGGPSTLGFLMGASGVGALVGAGFLARRKTVLGLGKIIALAACFFGVGIIGFSQSTLMWISMAFVLLTGLGMMILMASANTILQTIVEDDMRGRVMSFYAVAFLGVAPFGSLLAGSLAHRIGAPHTLLMGGICCILGSVAFAIKLPSLRKIARPIYVKKGIIPQLATGIQTAAELSMPPEDGL